MPPKTQYGLAQQPCAAFRTEYPGSLFKSILRKLPAGMRRRALDIGAGTGLSAAPLCEWFVEVIAVVPDAEMAARIPERSPRLRNERYSERVLRTSNLFVDVQVKRLPAAVTFDAARFTGFWSSTSYCSACFRTLPNPQPYLDELETDLAGAAGGGAIEVDFALGLILGQSPDT